LIRPEPAAAAAKTDFVMTDHAAWAASADDSEKLRVFELADGGRWPVCTTGRCIKHAEPYTAVEVPDQLAAYQQTVATLTAAATHPKQLDEVLESCLGLNPFDFAGVGS
jgi:hypothetical protein